MTTRPFLAIVLGAGLLTLSACDAHVAQRGVMPDVDAIASVQPQQTSRAEVEQLFGSPSSVNVFGKETWMYIGETTERVAFLERDVQERSVLIITFDDKGVVEDVRTHGLEASRDLEPVERETPTVGKQMTVIEQLVGNLNRFRNIGSRESDN